MKKNASIGTYLNSTRRKEIRVLTQVCSLCGRASAIVLSDTEQPDEGLCRGCGEVFDLQFQEEEES